MLGALSTPVKKQISAGHKPGTVRIQKWDTFSHFPAVPTVFFCVDKKYGPEAKFMMIRGDDGRKNWITPLRCFAWKGRHGPGPLRCRNSLPDVFIAMGGS